MITVEYEGRNYSYTNSGWVNENNISVPTGLQAFLRKKAISEGANPSEFRALEAPKPVKKATPKKAIKKKPKKISIKIFND